jgi:uncharacterized protein YndB with AHSA1/START domain/uncharacterized glyoxalase superfamily protein PhnB
MLALETSLQINAPQAAVWEALTQADIVKQYFFGSNLVTDWLVGSPIYFRGEYEGTAYEDKGTVLAFDAPYYLRYSYLSSWSGKPDLPENYAHISYALTEKNGITTVTVTQDNCDNEAQRDHSIQNWQMVLGGMRDLLAAKPRQQAAITGTRYVLAVKDLAASAQYYEQELGFTTHWKIGGWQQLYRETFVVMLGECPDDRSAFETANHSYFAYVDVQNIDALYHEYRQKNVEIHYPLEDKPWGQREFGIRTIDGHRIMFGEGIVEGG